MHMSSIELKECNYISFSVYMCFKCFGCVFVQLRHFLLSSESSRNGSKVRRGPFPFIPIVQRLKLHPTSEVHCAVPLSSAPHEIILYPIIRISTK